MDTPISIDPESGRPCRREHFDARTSRTRGTDAPGRGLYRVRLPDRHARLRGAGDAARVSLYRAQRDGLIERHRIRSTIYKRRAAVGEAASWVTIEPVAAAIMVLERLSAGPARASGARGDTLWPVLRASAVLKTHLSSEVVRQLNTFRDHLNSAFGTPDEAGHPARTRWQAVAHHDAAVPAHDRVAHRQPSVRHHRRHDPVQARLGRRVRRLCRDQRIRVSRRVEAQRRLGQIDDLLDYFDRRQGGASLGGPAGPRIARTLDDAAVRQGPLPAMIADRARLRVMLASVARTFHVGPLADCFFDPATALCLKRVTTPDPAGPLTALCEPTRCPSACITARHRPAWERAAADARAHLRERRISDLQRQALQRELDRLSVVMPGSTLPRRRPPRLLAESCAGRRARATASPSFASLRP